MYEGLGEYSSRRTGERIWSSIQKMASLADTVGEGPGYLAAVSEACTFGGREHGYGRIVL